MTFMQQALCIAEQGRATCMPNPMVGCIIVKDSTIVGSGAHLKAGHAHAEINALAQAGSAAAGADVYLTLEPCSHFGRTPPCVNALIAASVKSVHIAIADPNPLVAQNGIAALRTAGIDVFIGECEEQAYQLNKSFFYYITHKKPFVIAKWAMSLDGKIAGSVLDPWGPKRWITSEVARLHAHALRAKVGALMVGENTVRIDNPSLTVRHEQLCYGHVPRPVVLTATGNIPYDRQVFAAGRNTLVMTSVNAHPDFLGMLDSHHIEYCYVPVENNFLVLSEVLNILASRGISRLLVEGGSQLLTEFFRHEFVNEVYTYVAPKIIGGNRALSPIQSDFFINDEFAMTHHDFLPLGPDVCFIAETSLTSRTYEDFKKRSR